MDSLKVIIETIESLKNDIVILNTKVNTPFWKDYKFILPIIISLSALLLPPIIGRSRRREDRLNKLIETIELLKTELESIIENKEASISTKDRALNKLLTKYEESCSLYFKNKINGDDFKEKLNKEIIAIIISNKEMYESSISSYTFSAKYFKANHACFSIIFILSILFKVPGISNN